MRFNTKTATPVLNHAGAKAYTLTPALELYSAVVTASLQDQYYEGASAKLRRLQSLIAQNDPGFVARLAVYTREKMYLRSIPVVLAVELARIHTGDNLVSKMISRIVQRPDEIMELLAYYAQANKRKDVKKLNKLSKQVQKGLAATFNKFDEYQFAKYNRKAEVTLRDALFLVHPKAASEIQQALFKKIADDTLETPYTWETTLTAAGQVTYASDEARAQAFRKAWEDLIDSNKLGYMATLRNLRNMLQYDISTAHLQKVCDTLSDREAVLRSKQLPFRFLSAYRELKDIHHGMSTNITRALEKALQTSVAHLKGFDTDTRVVIACDVSGSMQKPVSANSKVLLYDIGLLMAMILQHKCQYVITGMFGDIWKIVNLSPDNILGNVQECYRREGEVGYATNGFKVLEDLIDRKYVADKIMLFTDGQLWDNTTPDAVVTNQMNIKWLEYKQIAPQAKLYLFDLAGYNRTPLDVRRNDVYLIGGWSDKIFEIMDATERGSDAITEISGLSL